VDQAKLVDTRDNGLGLTALAVLAPMHAVDVEAPLYHGLYVPEDDAFLEGDAALTAVVTRLMPDIQATADAEGILRLLSRHWDGLVNGSILWAEGMEAQQEGVADPTGEPPTMHRDGGAIVVSFFTIEWMGDLGAAYPRTLRIEADGSASTR
jgi:hypothetical protein